MVALVVSLLTVMQAWTSTAQQFNVVHNYAHLQGSPANNRGRGASSEYAALLRAHDRRRLAAVADFPVRGDDDPTSIGLYFTELKLGTPPRQYYVQVDTGSDILWLNCAPCPGCPVQSDIEGVTLQLFDPALSSTDKALGCSAADCKTASYGAQPVCTSNSACEYSVQYADGSSTAGYFINDMLTFQQVENSSTINATANVYFGCGTTQTGNLLSSTKAVSGIMGFGQAAVAVPSQLAALGKVGRVFAHCLQGNNLGGGTFVIGNILEPNISYTPYVPEQTHYNVAMQNIAVNGVNITTPASFAISPTTGGGVVMDSGTTLAYLPDPAYTQFVNAITTGAPVQVTPVRSRSDSLYCWVYSGNIDTGFPSVTLYFDGGSVMNLVATNYLYDLSLTNGGKAYCMGWQKSSSDFTIFGDIVLKDQLVVYDNEKQRLGWKPYDCTKSIRVSAPNSTTPMSVLPGSGGSSAGVVSALNAGYILSSCLAISLLFSFL
jgi:hypothetical protein